MATRHVVEEVEEPLEDVAAYRFVYGSDEMISKEGDDDGDEKNDHGRDSRIYDGGSSRASSNATSGLLEFLPLEKAFGIILGFLPDHTEIRKEVYCKHC